METLRELFLTLGLDADEASFASATAAVDLLEKGLELVAEAAKKVGEALVETVVGAVDYADKIGDAATKTGVSTTRLQEFEYAAVQSGTSFDGVVQALVFLNRNLYEASTAGGEAAAAFAQLGIKVKDTTGKLREPADVFLDLADAIEKVPEGAARSALAMKVLGRSGAELVPMLSMGKEGLEALRAEAWAMGAILKPDDLVRAKAFADTWAGMNRTFEAVRNELGLMLVQELIPIVDAFKMWWLRNNALVKSKLKGFIDGVRAALRGLWTVTEAVVKNFDLLIAVVKTAAVAVGAYFVASALVAAGSLTQMLVNLVLNTAAAVAYGAAMVVAGAKAAAAWVAATWPVIALTAALVLAFLVIEDITGALKGQDSLIGDIGPKWTKLIDAFANGGGAGEWLIVTQLRTVAGWLSDLEGRLLPAIKESWAASLLRPISATIELLFKLFRGTASFADYLKTIPGVGLFVDQAQDAARKIAPYIDRPAGELIGGGASSPAAAAANKPDLSPKIFAPRMNATITVQGAPGQPPEAIAERVQEKLEDWVRKESWGVAYTAGGS